MAVITGRKRGHGLQCAHYLLTQAGNDEEPFILEVDGNENGNRDDLKRLLREFSLLEELTRSKAGLYHATINPGPDDAAKMSDEDWQLAATLLQEELGFAGQRRALVTHIKDGRKHLHCVFERYSHETGKMIPVDRNYRKHDKTRHRIEMTFGHALTPQKNIKRPEMRKELTRLWAVTETGGEFITEARKQGYMVVAGNQKRPFRVMDNTGRVFDLGRQIENVRTSAIRERFKDSVLMEEKEAIGFVRDMQKITRKQGTQMQQEQPTNKPADAADAFAEQLKAQREKQQVRKHIPRMR